MSDEMTQPSTPAAPDTKKPGFLATPGGKIVAIVLGLCVLGILAGIAVAMLFAVFGTPEEDLGAQVQTPPASASSGVATTTAEVKAPSEEVANAQVFTFRDIFEPLIKPASTETSTSPNASGGSTGTTDTATPTASNTLYLDGIITENGVLKAQLRYNGQSYSLAAGGTIPNSPWEVLRVSSTSVIMLYGDVQVTVSVGQGITK